MKRITKHAMKQWLVLLVFLALFVWALVILQYNGRFPSLNQFAQLSNEKPPNPPPAGAYCSKHKDTLQDIYESFMGEHGADVIGYSFTTTWLGPNSVIGGLLVLRNFGYNDPNTLGQYQTGGQGSLGPVAGCYCKIIEESPVPITLANGFWERSKKKTLINPYVPPNRVGCCSAKDSNNVWRGEPYDTLNTSKMCCPSGKVVNRCSGSGACPSTVTGFPNITFETIRTSDNCCTSSSLSTAATTFLQQLGQRCSAKVTAARNACHAFGSDHYGGCAVDLTGVSSSCLQGAGYPINGSYSPGTCVWEGDHYHCTLCNSNGPGTSGYDDDGTY